MSAQNSIKILQLTIVVFFLIVLDSCTMKESGHQEDILNTEKVNLIEYDLKKPDAIFKLPEKLDEISGIAWLGKDKLACIQDEKAIIYIYDLKKLKIISEIHFGKDGDYEDIAVEGSNAYVLRSDGTVFEVENFRLPTRKTRKFNTKLSLRNNAEGLAYDKENKALLLACKESPSIDKEYLYPGLRAIYTFDLKTNSLKEKPAILIDPSKMKKNQPSPEKNKAYVSEFFTEIALALKLSDRNAFYPSAIALHPNNPEHIYLISSVGKTLIIINRQGEILDSTNLSKTLFTQAEGICFSDEGDLFISNEGKNGTATIVKFNVINKK